MGRTELFVRGRPATPPQTTGFVEISGNARRSHWKLVKSANQTKIPGLHAEPGEPGLPLLSPQVGRKEKALLPVVSSPR